VFTHDDESLGEDRGEGSKLTTAFQVTKAVWEETYAGELYDIPGSGYIPARVKHPVEERMGKLEGFFGRPVVERTGDILCLLALDVICMQRCCLIACSLALLSW
jgi:hypothetical protein